MSFDGRRRIFRAAALQVPRRRTWETWRVSTRSSCSGSTWVSSCPRRFARRCSHRGRPLMLLAEIEQLLTRAIGLDPSALGKTATGRAVEERQGICGIGDSRAYWNYVRASPSELQALI